MTLNDTHWMNSALELARKGEGSTAPNPPVGAVVVRADSCVGKGYHRKAGKEHAEVIAIKKAGGRARNAVLYVTLEPCSTHGRTPPCTKTIIQSGIRRVVISVRDPNPKNKGRGVRELKNADIRVTENVCKEQGARLIAPFRQLVTTGRPYVTLKLGMTADGRIADRNSVSQWITSPESRREVQKLRTKCDAILVGRNTVREDNPALLLRGYHSGNHFRVVLDSRGRLPLNSKVFSDSQRSRTIVAVTSRCSAARKKQLEAHGVTVWRTASKQGHVSLRSLLTRLGKLGCLHVLCEGGGELACGLAKEGLINAYSFFVAPMLLGGDGRPGLAGTGWLLKHAPRMQFRECKRMGSDILLTME